MVYVRIANCANFTFELTECDGSPVDLSNATVKFLIKREKTDNDEFAVLSGSVANSETNIVSFQFDATQTKGLETGKYYAALKVFKTNNLNNEVWNDYCTITKEVFND